VLRCGDNQNFQPVEVRREEIEERFWSTRQLIKMKKLRREPELLYLIHLVAVELLYFLN